MALVMKTVIVTGRIIIMTMGFSICSLVANIFVISIHENDSSSRMREPWRRFIFNYLGKMMCVHGGSGGNRIQDELILENADRMKSELCKEEHDGMDHPSLESVFLKRIWEQLKQMNRIKAEDLSLAQKERQDASKILDMFFLIVFTSVFSILGLYFYIIISEEKEIPHLNEEYT